MGKFIDIAGQKYGFLTALHKHPVSAASGANWVCQCDCGETIVASYSNLKSGNTKSCGCKKTEFMIATRISNHPPRDLIGEKHGSLLVIQKSAKRSGTNPMWVCLCDCGKTTTVIQENLLSNHTRSCGCNSSRNTIGDRSATHRKSGTRLYHVWRSMKSRCENKNTEQYKNYGGRGITVCNEWRNSFFNFYKWAMSNGYDPNAKFGECTIDRVDVNGNYEPNNCRWVSMSVQAKNKRKR